MKYSRISEAVFLDRPNRFIAKAELDGETVTAHVKNTGRCKEILIPGVKAVLAHAENPNRKTAFDLVAAYKGDLLINIDSQAPNKVYGEALNEGKIFDEIVAVRPEATYGDSRFDFLVEKNDEKIYTEVKGVTLEDDGVALFPDAPTDRGVKHLRGLASLISEGFKASVVFVVQMDRADYFMPNYDMHEEFGLAVEEAVEAGVDVAAYTCRVTEDSMELAERIPVRLRNGITL